MPVTLPFEMTLFNSPFWDNFALLVGQILLILIIVWIVFVIAMVALIVLSIKRKHLYFPMLLRPVLAFTEGAVATGCQVLGVDATQLMEFLIKIDNDVNTTAFAAVPVENRAVFFPQCLRSSNCPARLTPDGLKCVSCGRCGLGSVIPPLEEAGYKTFLIPGSTFIKRMVKKYRPQAMIGVGCILEVKEGLEMGKRISMITLGVVTKTDGCVETTMDWDELLEVASIGLPEPIVRREPEAKSDQ
ncbi:DUF116 domain-containing protein [Methanorbis rubei]|uniref:DUF116 domain-containing protein n=1 Tax=Methanorbis rubei TaxID=3028300 RepID=A0AAE4MFG2_9EURY|nr:hypothetical protein [Methanocorpusculaceae archaeon Cs1]